MLNAAQLKKFIKTFDLDIASIEEEKSVTDGQEVLNYVLHLVNPMEQVRGSQLTDKGAPIYARNVHQFRINEVDWDAFCKDATEDGDIIRYSGNLKADASRPRIDQRTGNVTRNSEAWLVSIPFNKRRGQMMRNNADKLSEVMATLFGKVDDNGAFIKPEDLPKKETPLKVVDVDEN